MHSSQEVERKLAKLCRLRRGAKTPHEADVCTLRIATICKKYGISNQRLSQIEWLHEQNTFAMCRPSKAKPREHSPWEWGHIDEDDLTPAQYRCRLVGAWILLATILFFRSNEVRTTGSINAQPSFTVIDASCQKYAFGTPYELDAFKATLRQAAQNALLKTSRTLSRDVIMHMATGDLLKAEREALPKTSCNADENGGG